MKIQFVDEFVAAPKAVAQAIKECRKMTDDQQIKAIAELDGEINYRLSIYGEKAPRIEPYKKYLTSRDAIVPVIEKCMDRGDIGIKACNTLMQFKWNSSAETLCEALLRATGKWVE